MNYSCLPIVTDVSCIGQYVRTDTNGVLLEETGTKSIERGILRLLSYSSDEIAKMQSRNYEAAKNFTYDHYMTRIRTEIFPKVFKDVSWDK